MEHDPSPRERERRPLSRRLDEEWRIIRRRRRLVERARGWHVTEQPFDDLDELLTIAGHRVEPTAAANDVLRRLVDVARHDELAARVVLQRMLPGLLATVRRRHSLDIDGSFEQLLGAAWLVIRAYQPELRPVRVAANLVRDAGYRAFIAPARRHSANEVTIDPHALDDTPAVVVLSSCDELAVLLREARAMGLSAMDLDFVRDLLRCGSSTRLAAERNVTPRTIRNHRTRAAARLRRCALVA